MSFMLIWSPVLPSGEGGGVKSDMDHKELLPKRLRQCLSTSLHHHTGKPPQVSLVILLLRQLCSPPSSQTSCFLTKDGTNCGLFLLKVIN